MFKKIFANIILIIFSFSVTGLILEISYRMWTEMPLTRSENFLVGQLSLSRLNSKIIDHDALLGWKLASHYGQPGSDFITGEYGIRMNGDTVVPSVHGSVLAVGDSFTAGSGVKNAETWPAQLEKIIHEPILNGSSGGWGTDQIVLRAEQLIEKIHPKTIIISLLAQDSLRNSFDLYGIGYKPWFKIETGELTLQGVPVPKVEEKPVWFGPIRQIFGRSWLVHSSMMRIAPLWWANVSLTYHRALTNKEGIEVSCKLMDRLAEMSKKTGIKVLTVMQYGAQESLNETPPWYGRDVDECISEAGLETLDTHAPLHQVSKDDHEKFVRFWLNEGGQLGHMSPEGNRFIASLIKEQYFKR